MEKEHLKNVNRLYLRKVFRLKTIFYPVTVLLIKTGLAISFEKVINKIISFFGIKKSIHYFFKYLDYSKWFRNQFNPMSENDGEIIFPVMTGVHSNFTLLNLLFAKYFRDKYNLLPVFYVCDSAFGICTRDGMIKSRNSYPWFCHECYSGYENIEKETGIETVRMSGLYHKSMEILKAESEKIEKLGTLYDCINYEFSGIKIGFLTKKSVLRYFLTGNLSDNNEIIVVFRRFLMAALQYCQAFINLLEERPAIRYVILNNGSLVFEAIARVLCERNGIPYMTYETYIGNNSLIYKKNGAVMDLDWEEEYNEFKKTYVRDNYKSQRVKEFFNNLRSGVEMYAVLNREHEDDKMKGVGKYVCLFTNLNYDTAVIDKNYLFGNMEEWIYSVIDFWKSQEHDITLVIRIHPGEIKLVTASKEYLGDRIINACGNSNNIRVIDSTDRVNSYELISKMEYGLIYSSTIGLEIAWEGKTCLVAGLPWFRNKPFVIYPESKEKYFHIIDRMNKQAFSFTPDMEELIRTVFFVYFNRVKRLKGIKLYTPAEEANSVYNDPEEMIKENIIFFEGFKNELFEEQ